MSASKFIVKYDVHLQFLDSYKSVTLESMATAFGVSVDFIDYELVDFIVAGRLPAKIDKVGAACMKKNNSSFIAEALVPSSANTGFVCILHGMKIVCTMSGLPSVGRWRV